MTTLLMLMSVYVDVHVEQAQKAVSTDLLKKIKGSCYGEKSRNLAQLYGHK